MHLQEWVIEMAAYVKSIDSNHLLEIGLEGFYGEDKKQINPGYQLIGTDFISNNLVHHVDFATMHLYPEQWYVRHIIIIMYISIYVFTYKLIVRRKVVIIII